MASVGIKPSVEHVGSRRQPGQLCEIKVVQASIDLASVAASDANKVNVTTFTGPDFSANAFVIPNPPAAIDASLMVFGVEVNAANDISFGVFNTHASAAVNETSAVWDFLVFDF